MIHRITEEDANRAARELRAGIRFHRNAARLRLRALERLERECNRHGIRLIREPSQTSPRGETTDDQSNPDDR